jgi:hypothetical protein
LRIRLCLAVIAYPHQHSEDSKSWSRELCWTICQYQILFHRATFQSRRTFLSSVSYRDSIINEKGHSKSIVIQSKRPESEESFYKATYVS